MATVLRSLVAFVLLAVAQIAQGAAAAATPVTPDSIAVDAAGNVYIADYGRWQVRKIAAGTGAITTIGLGLMTQGSATGLAVDERGNLFVADGQGGVIRRVDAATGGASIIAEGLDHPFGVAVDRSGNVFIAEWGGHRVREVSATTGIMTTVAGCGSPSFSGDGGPALQAGVPNPSGVAVDAAGNLYIAEWANNDVNRVRVVAADTGIITTFAGNGYCGRPEDGGVATEQSTCGPWSIVVGQSGIVFVADIYHRVYSIDPETKALFNIAGTGSPEFSGDDGPAVVAGLNVPRGIAVDAAENVYIADAHNNRVRKVDAKTRIITTIAGDGTPSVEEGRRRAVGH